MWRLFTNNKFSPPSIHHSLTQFDVSLPITNPIWRLLTNHKFNPTSLYQSLTQSALLQDVSQEGSSPGVWRTTAGRSCCSWRWFPWHWVGSSLSSPCRSVPQDDASSPHFLFRFSSSHSRSPVLFFSSLVLPHSSFLILFSFSSSSTDPNSPLFSSIFYYLPELDLPYIIVLHLSLFPFSFTFLPFYSSSDPIISHSHRAFSIGEIWK